MTHHLMFPPTWIDASGLEEILSTVGGPHEAATIDSRFTFPIGCKVMIDAAVRLLSLLNQLDHSCRFATLDFEEGESGVMGYLSRMGFFDYLPPNIAVEPARPTYSGAELFGGGSRRLVEIAKISRQSRDESLPTRLTDTLMLACQSRSDVEELGGAAWTIFAE